MASAITNRGNLIALRAMLGNSWANPTTAVAEARPGTNFGVGLGNLTLGTATEWDVSDINQSANPAVNEQSTFLPTPVVSVPQSTAQWTEVIDSSNAVESVTFTLTGTTLSWTPSGGSPTVHYAFFLDGINYSANRNIMIVWDLGSDVTLSSGQTWTLNPPVARYKKP